MRSRGAPLMRARARLAVAGALAVLAAGAVAAHPRPGRTELVSATVDGLPPSGSSDWPSISGDGRFVAFHSWANDLVTADDNEQADVFVRDIEAGKTELVSVATGGAHGELGSFLPAMSADGRYVAFYSGSSNLVPGDTNGRWDVFVRDRVAGTTQRVSVASDGSEGNGNAWFPSISADGRVVGFESFSSNLVAGDTNGVYDVFAHDRTTGQTERISVSSSETQGGSASYKVVLSADGRRAAFHSGASNLAPGDTNGFSDMFVRDRVAGTTEQVSSGWDGTQPNGDSYSLPAISGDGRVVAFYSDASNLVPGDANGIGEVFVRDLAARRTERASVATEGTETDGEAVGPRLSPDGRFVGFWTTGALVPSDTNVWFDSFIHDRLLGATDRVSIGNDAVEGNGDATGPVLGPDARHLAFPSTATNLVPGAGGSLTIYARDRGPVTGIGRVSAALTPDGVEASGWATFTGDVLADAPDPADTDDVGSALGGDLTGARIAYLAEAGELVVRLEVPDPFATPSSPPQAPRTQGMAGAPGVVYGLRLQVGTTRYEVRGGSAAASVEPPAVPGFALYRCAASCTQVAVLGGSVGTTGTEVRFVVPLAGLGAEPGATLSDLVAFSVVGEPALGSLRTFDEVAIPAVTIPAAGVTLGIAPAGSAPGDVLFDVPAVLTDGAFRGTLPRPGPGSYEIWARACLGQRCGDDATSLTL